MDLAFTPADDAFRREVRSFIEREYPAHLRGVGRAAYKSREDFMAWHRTLYRKGWIAPAWPVEYGGTGWSLTQRYIFNEECAAAETQQLLPFGLSMVGPVIFTFGSAAQKARHLPGILSGDVFWCQGYSEPGSGSDLASLKTRAVRDGNHYVVNGQKIWTTQAHNADWIFCLVRTDPNAKAQEGISFLLIDMKTPGISVRPIITMEGAHEVNEVFFDNVRVPVENLVGKENEGWTYAKFLLVNERSGIAGVARSKRQIARIRDIARAELIDGRPLITDPAFSRKIVELEIDLTALEFTELRTLASESAGEGGGPASSILKIKGTEIQQRITELVLEAVGNYAHPWVAAEGQGSNEYIPGPDYAAGAGQAYASMRKTSIYGGSNEIQRNIIAKMVLGL